MKLLNANIEALQKKAASIEQDYIKELSSLENQKKELFARFKEVETKYKDKEKVFSFLL